MSNVSNSRLGFVADGDLRARDELRDRFIKRLSSKQDLREGRRIHFMRRYAWHLRFCWREWFDAKLFASSVMRDEHDHSGETATPN